MKKDAILWKKLPDQKVECYACARRCKIPLGSHGFCFVRQNVDGKLQLINYGTVAAVQVDPIEKKPFNHFMPGTYVFGIGTSSCNWGCQFCQNHNISKEREIEGAEMRPKTVIDLALKNNTQSIAFTYNEPTIFIEYALDVAEEAHKHGLKNLFVTNGYMTPDTVREMTGKIDAAVVDFKGNADEKFANKYEMVMSNEPIKEALLEMKKSGIHVELTDLVIPRVGDSLEACAKLCRWLYDNMGPDIPLQFTRFHPDYKMLDYPETSYETLKGHYDVARRTGLNYVYIGNVPGNPYENTYCPKCSAVAIERRGLYLTKWDLGKGNGCRNCGYIIPIVGSVPQSIEHRSIASIY